MYRLCRQIHKTRIALPIALARVTSLHQTNKLLYKPSIRTITLKELRDKEDRFIKTVREDWKEFRGSYKEIIRRKSNECPRMVKYPLAVCLLVLLYYSPLFWKFIEVIGLFVFSVVFF